MEEWSPSKKWNPFNSYKLLAQVYRWREIRRGSPVPQPSLITVDPVNICNYKCHWCNANFILERNKRLLDRDLLMDLADFLKRWQGSPQWPAGVESICIAGGGEPLLNPHVGQFIDRCVDHGIEVGVVTNGHQIHKFLEPLSRCTWVGISVDAGTPDSYASLKGIEPSDFSRVCDNIRNLVDFSRRRGSTLASDRAGYGVSYKYLLVPDNVADVEPAIEMAASLGCKNFHLRPAGVSWDRIRVAGPVHDTEAETRDSFTEEQKQLLESAFRKARRLENDQFGVYGVTHKFDHNFNKANVFSSCHAVFMTCVVMPPRVEGERFRLGLCCDRRGDQGLEFSGPLTEVTQIGERWSSPEHWRIRDQIDLRHCPRCTYQPHNQIYEHVIQEDSMTYKFI
ncbi:MAG: radical SAM protein [Magnetococcales bacterium]|nr:radical SAM protein [Magnetococcales bacterium]MBF0155659.1 radical SAM protein [Magnetococcales bacterium]